MYKSKSRCKFVVQKMFISRMNTSSYRQVVNKKVVVLNKMKLKCKEIVVCILSFEHLDKFFTRSRQRPV